MSRLDGGPFVLMVGGVEVRGDSNAYQQRVVVLTNAQGEVLSLRAESARALGIALQAVAVCTDQARER